MMVPAWTIGAPSAVSDLVIIARDPTNGDVVSLTTRRAELDFSLHHPLTPVWVTP